MANHKATGKKAARGPELATRIRMALLSALDIVDASGSSVQEILAEKFKEDPLRFMDMASKYVPRQLEAEVTHTITASELTDDELADIAAGRSAGVTGATDSPQEPASIH